MKSGLLAAIAFLSLHALVPQNNSGTIEGMAQRTDTKAPIAGVRVTVATTPINGAPLYSATTGNDGHFMIADVPPGMYFIFAERDGYLPDWGAIPPSAARPSTTTARVAAQQHLQLQAFNFIPGAVLGGRVRDRDAKPVAGLSIELLKKTYIDTGLPQLNVYPTGPPAATNNRTNDRGEYQLPAVGPGEYYIRVRTPLYIGNASLPAASPVDLQQPIYFPGVSSAAVAMQVSLKPGSAVTANIEFPAKSTLKVSGMVINGFPNLTRLPQTNLILIPNDPGIPIDSQTGSLTVLGIPEGSDGRFEFRGILPGSYEIFALARETNPNPPTALLATPMARSTFTVGEMDTNGITLTVRPGVEVKGKFISESTVTLTPPLQIGPGAGVVGTSSAAVTRDGQVIINGQAAAGPQLRISLAAKDSAPQRTIQMTGANGTEFTFAGVPPGAYAVSAQIFPQLLGMYVADIRQRDSSIFENGLTVGTQPPDPIEIVIKSNAGSVQGTIVGGTDSPFDVTLLPQGAHSGNSFMTKTFREPASLVSLNLTSIPPGEYRLLAADTSANLDFRNPEMLRKYAVKSVAVTVNAGSVTSGITVAIIHAGE
jgi:hypothetical protein